MRNYADEAMGLIETLGMVPAIYGADAMLKAADVQLFSMKTSVHPGDHHGQGGCGRGARFRGRGQGRRRRHRQTDGAQRHAPPVRGVGDIALYTGVMDEPNEPPLRSLAMIETFGIVYMLEAADAMIKAADVELIGYENVASGYISVLTQGDVAACKAAVAAGIKAVEAMGASVYSSCVIPTPHRDLVKMTRRYAIENLLA